MGRRGSFPERHIVGFRKLTLVDDGMSQTETWADPVDLPVYGWGPPSPDDVVRAEQTGVTHVLDVFCAESPTGHKDKLIVNGVEYSVQGTPDDYRFGPFGYQPGVRVRLSKGVG